MASASGVLFVLGQKISPCVPICIELFISMWYNFMQLNIDLVGNLVIALEMMATEDVA